MDLEEILESHKSIIHSIINSFYIPDGLERDDLEQVGLIGVWKAFKKFKPGKNAQFSTYAYVAARNEILSLLRKHSKYKPEINNLYDYHSESYEMEKEIMDRLLKEDLEKEEKLIIQYLYEGYTQREIAKILDTTQPRICQRIRAMRIKVKRRWGELS